jgi:putative DNA primase/helicase
MSLSERPEQCKSKSTNPTTHAWGQRASELAEWGWERLVNRTDVWGGYIREQDRGKEYTRADGTTCKLGKTTTRPAQKHRGQSVLAREVLVQHFRARDAGAVIGLHTTSPDNTSKWGGIDIDHHGEGGNDPVKNWEAALHWYDRLVARGFRPLLIDSNGAGGYHLRILFASAIPTPRLFWFLRSVVADHASVGLGAAPELFPKQSEIKPDRYGNWMRVPGRHHSREHWSRVWSGSEWLDGNDAIDHLLSLTGDPVDLVPENSEIDHRIRAYIAKVPNLGEGQGRDDLAYTLLSWLARDMHLDDAVALDWAETWDCHNTPPKGRERLAEILVNVHQYGQQGYGSGLERDGYHKPAPQPNAAPREVATPPPAAEPEVCPTNEGPDDPHRLARLYVDGCACNGEPTIRYWREEYHQWDGCAYRKLQAKELRARLNSRVKEEYDLLARHDRQGWDEAGRKNAKGKNCPPPVARQVTTRKVGDVQQALDSLVVLPGSIEVPAWLGMEPFPAHEVLACPNGLIHLPSLVDGGQPYQHPVTPRFFSPNSLDYPFDEYAPSPERWLAFLRELWPNDQESIDTLQEVFGYLLLPDTRQHKIFLAVGPKRGGKGTIARVLSRVIGLANVCNPTLASLGTNFGLWPLVGKTLAIISDARLSHRTDTAVVVERLLAISGEDGQTIDRKNLSPVTCRLPVRFLLLTNELPRLTDQSGALAGRLIILRMTRSWYGRENPRLTDQLLTELPGILSWAIVGWMRLRERGYFVQPASSLPLVRDIEDLASPMGAFVRERCVVGAGYDVPVDTLFTSWQNWCEVKGRREPGTEQVFGRDLRTVLPHINTPQRRKNGRVVRVFTGVRLRDENDPEVEEVEA